MKALKFSVATLALLAMTTAAMADTYNGIQTIDQPADLGGGEFVVGTATGENIVTVDGTGSNKGIVYNIGGSNGIWVAGTGSGRSGTLIVTGAGAVVGAIDEYGFAPESGASRAVMKVMRSSEGTGRVFISDGGTIYAGTTTLGASAGTTVVTKSGSGSSFDIYRASGTGAALMVDNGAQYTQTGGSLYVGGANSGNIALINSGLMDIQGGDVEITAGLQIGSASGASATFKVTGGSAYITIGGTTEVNDMASFVLNSSGISAVGTDVLTIADSAKIQLSVDGSLPSDVTEFTLFTYNTLNMSEGLLGNILDAPAGWTLQTADLGEGSMAIQAVIPEPATMALLGLGLAGLALRRRRIMAND